MDAGELIAAIEAVHRGDYLIDPIIAVCVLSEFHLGMPALPHVEPLPHPPITNYCSETSLK